MSPELEAVAAGLRAASPHKEFEDSEVRWLFVVNWVVSKLCQANKDFDPLEFYKACGRPE